MSGGGGNSKRDLLSSPADDNIELARKTGKLELSDMGLTEIPESAFVETFRIVWLFGNRLSFLSGAIQRWKSVQQLKLNGNCLVKLPPEIGKLRMLAMLFISDNKLICIPEEIQGCKNLQVLDCRNNCIKRLAVELGYLTNLYDFQYDGNPLDFPHRTVLKGGRAQIMKYFKRFIDARKSGKLVLTNCSLPEIPQEVEFVGTKLVELDIADVQIGKGLSMPFALGCCANLKTIKFNPQQTILFPPETVISKGLPEVLKFLHRFWTANTEGSLDMSSQGLIEFPAKMFDERVVNVESIFRLTVNRNRLNNVPITISSFENLTYLDLSSNCLDTIPTNISKLRKLRQLNLSGNLISEIPEFLARMPCLEEICARDNRISVVSEELEDMCMLSKFDVGNNKLMGLPICVSGWKNLRTLIVDQNQLVAVMTKIHLLDQLSYLDLSSNSLSSLPAEIGGLANLNVLILNRNGFYEIPEAVGNLTNLEVLELEECTNLRSLPNSISNIVRFSCPFITGTPKLRKLSLDPRYIDSPPASAISRGISEVFDFLLFLRLSFSTGDFFYTHRSLVVLPYTVCLVTDLRQLDLSNNELSQDSFPPELTNLANLSLLVLDHNRLETLPEAFVGLKSLNCICLRGNPLTRIPLLAYRLTTLTTLELSLPPPILQFPPKEISTRGGQAVLDFLKRFAVADSSGSLHISRLSLSCMPEEIVHLNIAISELFIAHNRLYAIHPAIKLMYNVKVLHLHDNFLDRLPNEMESLTALVNLDLEGNRLESCPSILSCLTSLTILNMARNDMIECPLPISTMTMLVELYLDHNRINALPNRIGRCARLVQVSLSHNQLTKLPASIRDLTCLTHLNLANNMFTIVPAELGLLGALDVMDLDGNVLESPPPQILEMGTWAVLRYLEKINQMFVTGHVNLDSCKLTTIPLDVMSYDAVHTLIITNNCLQTLPHGIGRLRHLKNLDLAYNSIVELPAAIGDCVALEDVNLVRNPMLHKLPLEFGQLVNLKFLDLDHESMISPPETVTRRGAKEVVRYLNALKSGAKENKADFSGFDLKEIPAEVMNMVNVTDIRLGKNKLDSIPASVAKFTGLKTLVLDENLRMRDLPQTMRLMTALQEISLSGNHLKTIPDEIFRLTSLVVLCFSHNELDGLGGLIGKLSLLQMLDLSYNKLWTLPWPSMALLKCMKSLNLQGNPFTYVSASVGQMTSLTAINLSDTNLPSLPAEIVDLVNLQTLELENVNLQGPALPLVAQGLEKILEFLSKIKAARYQMELQLLDLECEGGTSTGLLPYQLCSVLQNLTISRSKLYFVPEPVLELSLLTALDLSENLLKQLPSNFGQCYPFLETFTAQDNRISALPKSVGSFTSLTFLCLSRNALETLPREISSCTSLTHLDLTDNQITFLPKEARKLTKLIHLDMVFRCLTDFQNLDLAWNMWGKPPADITLQGGKVVKRFYRELFSVSGTSEALLDRLQGPQSTLNLSHYGLLRMPAQVLEKHMFSHLVTLDLSHNKIERISADISRLSKLQLVDLTACPMKHITPSLGALDADLRVEIGQLSNVPEPWIQRGKSGVMEYVKKAYLEINSGCMDFTGCGLRCLPTDVSDFLGIKELFIANNSFTRFPSSIGLLTNLTSLRAQNNKISCVPRDIHLLTRLQRLSLQGNRVLLLPTELGLLTSITELGCDSQTFPSVPSTILDGGCIRILKFLRKLEVSRGQQVHVRPPPGLRVGQTFDLFIKNQHFSITVPRGYNHQHRKGFIVYLPDISNERRVAKVTEGFEFMNNTMVGLVLDISGLELRELQLMALPGAALDVVQQDIFERSEGAKETVGSSIFGPRPQRIGAADYEISSEGIVNFKTNLQVPHLNQSRTEQEAEGGFRSLVNQQIGKVFDFQLSNSVENSPDLPTNRYFTNDLVSVWMVNHEVHSVYPMPIGVATSLTSLHLDNNKIRVIPSSIGTLSNLIVLTASKNRLENISWRLRYLKFLQEIDFSENRLTELPPKLGRCESLELVNLSANLLVRLPVSVGRLTKLRILTLDSNPIEHLPHEIGGIDDIENRDIRGLISIQRLSLRECEKLLHLPSKLYRLTQLQELDLEGASGLVTPPSEVHEEGIKSIFSFLRSLYDAEQSLTMKMNSKNLFHAPVILAELNTHLNERQGKYLGMPLLKHLDLSQNQISQIPTYMGLLTNLRTLILDYNQIRRISPVIANYTRLVLLSLQHNSLSSFCDEVSMLVSIRTVCADFNEIENVCEGFCKLSTLQVLSLEYNCLRSVPPVLLKLSGLQSLRLSSNKITKMPDDISKIVSLEQLLVRDNMLSTLPEALGNMSALQELDIADNKIEILPLGIGKLTALTKLETRRNGIIRPSKSTQSKGPKAVIDYLQRIDKAVMLKLLNLENFGLTSFPLDVILLDLTELNVSGNSLATIPDEILLLTRIVTLRLAENNIQALPTVVGRLSTLETLDLHDNKLQGLPVTLQSMKSLLFLDLSGNKLEILPAVLETLTQIEHLNVTNNLLTRMPYWIGAFGRASAILLAGNQLCTMPNSIGALGPVILNTLNLSNNGLIKLPTEICAVLTLVNLAVSGNALQELPSSLGRLFALQILWIDNNFITRLPPTYQFWINLNTLYAHNNHIKSIPGKFVELQGLRILTLSGNSIELIPDLSLLSNLEEIWLDNNQLATIPYFEKLTNLKSFSCACNPLLDSHLERAKALMAKYYDPEVESRMALIRRQIPRVLEEEIESPVVVREVPKEHSLGNEIRNLEDDLHAALDASDYDLANKLQQKLDVLGSFTAAEKYRPSSAVQNFTLNISILSCNDLKFSKKQDRKINAYVSTAFFIDIKSFLITC
jgi:Leucine-rich repeat (LRR) protein